METQIESTKNKIIPVTKENFVRAETDRYFGDLAKEGGFGKFFHRREVYSIDDQVIVRGNRDTLYSSAVFDLDAGPVTIALPESGSRFRSLLVIDEDHYVVDVAYESGSYTYSKEKVGTRYVFALIRTLVNPADKNDVSEVHMLQDQTKVSQKSQGTFEVPNWDKKSLDEVRASLVAMGSTLTDSTNTFGKKEDVDPIKHLIGTAVGWGGNPETEATYFNIEPTNKDGKTIYKLNVKDVPVDGFWSVTVYNAEGYFDKNNLGAYSYNNITAKKDLDGSVTIQFGGCGNKDINCVPIMKGWNVTVRLYRPRGEILNGSWKFPELQPLQ